MFTGYNVTYCIELLQNPCKTVLDLRAQCLPYMETQSSEISVQGRY